MENYEETVKIYHTGDSHSLSQILALAESDKIKTTEQNICKEKLSGTQLLTLCNKLDISLDKLVNRESELYKSELKDVSFDEAEWLQVLTEYPDLIKNPIAEKGKEVLIIETPTDILKLKNIDKRIDGQNHI